MNATRGKKRTELEKARKAFPFHLLKKELDQIDQSIRDQGNAFDPAVEPYVSYVSNQSGKRIRPALVMLAGGATGGFTDEHKKLGTILELIHVATLVHDDIIDGADIRRQAPTANAKWGNSLAVLLGDCLFAHALMLSTEFDDASIGRDVAKSANQVCSGEIKQTQRRFDFQLTMEDYFEIIEMKTGALFATAMELGARLNQVPLPLEEALRNFGMQIGTAFQIYDDCLDLVGTEENAGKTLRTDLNKGKLTLPILTLLNQATDRQREKLNKLLIQKEPIDVNHLANIADYEGAIEQSIDTAKDLVEAARGNLIGLGTSRYKSALTEITLFLDGLLDDCRQ